MKGKEYSHRPRKLARIHAMFPPTANAVCYTNREL